VPTNGDTLGSLFGFKVSGFHVFKFAAADAPVDTTNGIQSNYRIGVVF